MIIASTGRHAQSDRAAVAGRRGHEADHSHEPRHGARVAETQRSPHLTPTNVVAVTAIIAFAVLVGADGPAPWPAVRAAMTLFVGAGFLLARRRLGPIAGALAVLALGIAGVVAGLGIGINHLIQVPLSVEAIAGVLTLLGGLSLATLGTIRLTDRLRRWWKLLAVPIALLTLALVVLPLTLAVFVTNAPPFAATTVTPADRGLTYDDIELITADDVRLDGYYIPSTNGAAIIVLGGISGIGRHEVDIAAMLAHHGYGVLLLNTRGQGDSQGDAMQWGWWGEVDVAAGVDFLATRHGIVDGRIGAIGMSVGGEQAISAAGTDKRLRAVVSEGATARGARDEGDPARGVGGLLTRYVDWLSRRAAAVMTAADTPTPLREAFAAFREGQHALLIAAGTSSQEIAASEVFRAAAPERVDVWIAPDASHTGALRAHPIEWEARVINFFESALGS